MDEQQDIRFVSNLGPISLALPNNESESGTAPAYCIFEVGKSCRSGVVS